MVRAIGYLLVAGLLGVMTAVAAAGELTDEGNQLKLKYDDADWSSAEGSWPLKCTDRQCVTFSCALKNDGNKDSNEEVLEGMTEVQALMLEDDADMEELSAPEIRTFGATTGVHWVNRYDDGETADLEHVFSIMTLGAAARVTLVCNGETLGGVPVDDIFQTLMAGVELY